MRLDTWFAIEAVHYGVGALAAFGDPDGLVASYALAAPAPAAREMMQVVAAFYVLAAVLVVGARRVRGDDARLAVCLAFAAFFAVLLAFDVRTALSAGLTPGRWGIAGVHLACAGIYVAYAASLRGRHLAAR